MLDINYILKNTSPDLLSVFAQFPGILCLRDNQGHTLWGNETMISIAGFCSNPHKLEGLSDFDAPWCDDAHIYIAHDQNAYSGLRYRQLEPFLTNEGYKAHLVEKSPLRDKDGNIIAVLATAMEVKNKDILMLTMLANKTESMKKKQPLIISDDHYLDEKFSHYHLTKREMECLFYILRGKCAKTIARILDISFRTVECHVDNLKQKFDCHCKAELIDKAVSEGFMSLLPEEILKRNITNCYLQ